MSYRRQAILNCRQNVFLYFIVGYRTSTVSRTNVVLYNLDSYLFLLFVIWKCIFNRNIRYSHLISHIEHPHIHYTISVLKLLFTC